MENTSPAKNICGHLAVWLSNDVKLALSAGYGHESSSFRLDGTNSAEAYEKSIGLDGVPVECEIQVSKPLVILSGIRPFIGLGIGYYHYRSSGDVRSGPTVTGFENRINGLAQYFSFGMEFRLGRTVSAFAQAKKMGFSGIKASGDYYTGGKFEQPVRSENGLNDLSLAVGILFNLRPGEENTLLEKLR
jgi:hypothetical protein